MGAAESPKPWRENAHDQTGKVASPHFARQILPCPQHTWGSVGPFPNERPELCCVLEAGMGKAVKNWRGWGWGWRCQWSGTTNRAVHSPTQSKVLPNKVPDKALPSQAPCNPSPPRRPRLSSEISPPLLLFILPLPERLGAVPAGPGFNPESPKPEGSQAFLSPPQLAPVALRQWLGSLGTFSPHTCCTS